MIWASVVRDPYRREAGESEIKDSMAEVEVRAFWGHKPRNVRGSRNKGTAFSSVPGVQPCQPLILGTPELQENRLVLLNLIH